MNLEFCLPIYNEEKILEKNLLKLLYYCQEKKYNFSWSIILIINGSNDNSLPIAKKLNNKYPDKIKYVNIAEAGKGWAIKKYFLQSSADILCYMDIDLAVSLENIDDLINPVLKNQADLVFGSRLLPNSKIERTFLRSASSRIYNYLSRIILNHNFSDLQCGFKAIKTNKFKKIAPLIKDNAWFFDTELIIWTKFYKFIIKEIPVNWSENRYDKRKSKIHLFKESFIFLKNLIILKTETKKYKKYEINNNNPRL